MRLVSVSAGDAGYRELAGSARLVPVVLLQLAIYSLIVGNVSTLPILNMGSRQAPLFVNDVTAVALVAVGALLTVRAQSLKLDGVAIAALVFAAIGAGSAVMARGRYGLSTYQLIASLAYLARWTVYFGIYVVILNCLRDRDIRVVWTALERLMLAFAGFGIFQSIFLPDLGPRLYPEAKLYLEVDPQGHRLVSTLLEPNIAAAMIFIVLLVHVAQMAYGVPVRRWKPTLLLVALTLTLSRSGAVGFLAGLLVIALARGVSKRVLRFFTRMLLISLPLLPALIVFAARYGKFEGFLEGSAASRLIAWQRAIVTFLENPWFGIGFNTYGYVQERLLDVQRHGAASYSAEGGLLFIAVLTGVVGLAVYITMLGITLRRCRAVWRSFDATPAERAFCVGTAAATVAVLAHSVFVNSLLTPFIMELLWVLWGITFLIAVSLRRRRREQLLLERQTPAMPVLVGRP